jgi:hypothetical protein
MSTGQSATLASVASSATSVNIFTTAGGGLARVVFNDSTAVLYLKFGFTASTTSHTVQIAAGGYYEFPQPLFLGNVDGIWASANGFARSTSW